MAVVYQLSKPCLMASATLIPHMRAEKCKAGDVFIFELAGELPLRIQLTQDEALKLIAQLANAMRID
jgi:hypothetical protein